MHERQLREVCVEVVEVCVEVVEVCVECVESVEVVFRDRLGRDL